MREKNSYLFPGLFLQLHVLNFFFSKDLLLPPHEEGES